jgi:4-hydroxybenzoate polyprenyltransferase
MSQTRTVVMNPISISIALVQAMRPHQWIKNLLIFAALLFTAQFLNPTLVWQTVLGFHRTVPNSE